MTDPALVGFAFSLGLATFFAPCAFPLLPGYVAFFVGRDGEGSGTAPVGQRLGRAVTAGLATSAGFFLVFSLLAAVVFALGTGVLRNVAVLELAAGVTLIVLGGATAAGRLDASAVHVPLPQRRRGPVGYLAFGIVYAAAAAGCTGSLFVGIASLALSDPWSAVSLFGAYAGGMSVLMVGVTLLSALGRDALIARLSPDGGRITRIAGVAMVVAGLVQLYYFLTVFDGLGYL